MHNFPHGAWNDKGYAQPPHGTLQEIQKQRDRLGAIECTVGASGVPAPAFKIGFGRAIVP